MITVKQLDKFLKRKAIKRSGFARECGYTPEYIDRIRRGDAPITDKAAKKFKEVMDRYGG